jgi:gentisate 1,2-dioxygenase
VVDPAQYAYRNWIESLGLPIHEGYFVEDLREIELGWWDARGCNAAFLALEGQQNVSEARVTEIRPGETLPPLKFALDEAVYVVEGQGICTVWQEGGPKHSFEWQKHGLFLLPRNAELFFNNAWTGNGGIDQGEFYSEAKVIEESDPKVAAKRKAYWKGNFFPDMRAWDQLVAFRGRGAGGRTIFIEFPGSPMSCHMSVFDAGTYKKGHRHGPSYVIVIPAGEGYSVMWPEGGDKVVVPWREGSVFVPPDYWYHQHFNVADEPARYLALHPPRPFAKSGIPGNQIEYPEEEPFIREKFEAELKQRGLGSLMPPEAYQDASFEWTYAEG